MRGDYAAVPSGRRIYAVGDIHGCRDLLESLMQKIRRDMHNMSGTAEFVFVGDYIDRGRDSRGVIEYLLNLPRDAAVHFLRGNHDQALLNFLDNPSTYREWKEYGADETLRSYGVQPPGSMSPDILLELHRQLTDAIPPNHLRFLSSLLHKVDIGDYLFVHAGIRPGVPLADQSHQDLLWMRDEFLDSEEDHGKVIVHGHTPYQAPDRRDNRIGLDTGAYLTGRLTAAVLEGTRCRFLHT